MQPQIDLLAQVIHVDIGRGTPLQPGPQGRVHLRVEPFQRHAQQLGAQQASSPSAVTCFTSVMESSSTV